MELRLPLHRALIREPLDPLLGAYTFLRGMPLLVLLHLRRVGRLFRTTRDRDGIAGDLKAVYPYGSKLHSVLDLESVGAKIRK
jgi:hypothetical protein